MRRHATRTFVLSFLLTGAAAPSYAQPCPDPSPDIVTQWANLLMAVSGPGVPPAVVARNQGNQIVSRAMATMHAAVYDAVNAIDQGHSTYKVDARSLAQPGASAEAAAAQAAHDVVVGLYSRPAEIALADAMLASHLCDISNGAEKDTGIALGRYVAAQMLEWRRNDGASAVVPYTIGTEPGDWQPTPPSFALVPATPQWPHVTPFALTSRDQFLPGPPPELTSADYREAFDEVEALGGNGTTTPSVRTPEQTEIGLFWAGTGVTNAGVAIWNQIAERVSAERDLSLPQKARLFALLNVTIADAFIAGFDAKYGFQNGHGFWRPVTAIRAVDPTWTPLITTPNHPSYVALHAAQSEAAAQALAAFFGTDHVRFTASWAGVERSFKRFTAAAHEAGMSRVFAGVHWSFDVAAGRRLGRNVGQYVAENFFKPQAIPKRATAF